jgi:ketosteroid isomerase-like protein
MPLPQSARAATLALFACVLIAWGAHARSANDDALAANEAFYKALSARDPNALGKLTAHSDYIAWGSPISTDIAIGWPAVQKIYQGLATHFQTLQTSASDVHVHVNGRTAWVIGKEHAVGTRDNASFDWNMTTVNVFERVANRWLLVVHHPAAPVK